MALLVCRLDERPQRGLVRTERARMHAFSAFEFAGKDVRRRQTARTPRPRPGSEYSMAL